jgi:HlyD family secretion protein
MFRLLRNRRVWLSAAVVGVLLAVAFWPATVTVDVATIGRGPLVVTVDEEGRTRVRQKYVVSSPVAGRVLRIDLEPGDAVAKDAVVARVQPETPPLLDARARAEAQAAVDAATAALGRARAEEQRARAALDQAKREVARTQQLAADGLAAPQQLDARLSDEVLATQDLNAASYAVSSAQSALQGAQSRLRAPAGSTGAVVSVQSPIDGVVLRRLRESESVVPAGEALVEIGDPRQLEIVSDLLSTDAVRVTPGARVMIEQWGGDGVIEARVRRIEPSGFTKISALGVEEQRVNAILDFADPAGAWTQLGDGYRVEVRIVVWESPDVLKVPTGALFRDGDRWAVYVVHDGRAVLTVVELGHQTGREAEVLSGLAAGAEVILHPGDTIVDDARVEVRARP